MITDPQEQLVHVSRDATAIADEAASHQAQAQARRPRKGEERPKEPSRLERQQEMTLPEMLDDLPQSCAVGTKRNAKGYQESWIARMNGGIRSVVPGLGKPARSRFRCHHDCTT